MDISRSDVKEPTSNPERVAAEAHLPLTPAVFHIMLALSDRERHGYAVMLEIERLTDGQVSLGPGTLYRSLQRMLAEGWIEERQEEPRSEGDERRRYYRLTETGRALARAEARRLAVLVDAAQARGLLMGPVRELPSDLPGSRPSPAGDAPPRGRGRESRKERAR